MMKNVTVFIIAALTIVLSSCSDQKSDYIKNTHIDAGFYIISLGKHIDSAFLKGEGVSQDNKHADTYSVRFGENGGMMFTGIRDYRKLFLIKKAIFTLKSDSTVRSITGIWYPNDPASPSNDIKTAEFTIKKALGDPTDIRPITWKESDCELMIGTISTKNGEIQFVSASLK